MQNDSTKICKKCWLELPATPEFFSVLVNKKLDGSSYVIMRWNCKKCQVKQTRSWQINNPEKFHSHERKRRLLLQNAPGAYTKTDIDKIRMYQDNQCYYCGCALNNEHIDHKIPLSKWGTNYPSNLVLSCHSCNLDKHGKSAKEFFEWRKKCSLPVNDKFFSLEK